jgi:hypothetical protein
VLAALSVRISSVVFDLVALASGGGLVTMLLTKMSRGKSYPPSR